MGLNTVMEYDKRYRERLSHITIPPSNYHCLETKTKCTEGRSPHQDDLIEGEDFTEIRLGGYQNASGKKTPSRPSGFEGNGDFMVGSVHRRSKEMRKLKRWGADEERRKIEISCDSDTSFSYRFVDSLCSSDEESLWGTSELEFICDQVVGPLNDGNGLIEEDKARLSHRSVIAKMGMALSPARSKTNENKASPKSHSSPIRKMLDPFKKTKSHRSPLGSQVNFGELEATKTVTKAAPKSEANSKFSGYNGHRSVMASSPVHLHASLRVKSRHGVPSFEFSLKSLESVYVAKTWKGDDAFNWVYTFHSISNRKRNNAVGWGMKDSRDTPMVGQMKVSCSEQKRATLNNSMVTEFVAYDIGRAKKIQENLEISHDIVKSPLHSSGATVLETSINHEKEHGSPISYPLTPTSLRPDLEIAAITVEIPLRKLESIKVDEGGNISDRATSDLLVFSPAAPTKKDLPKSRNPSKLNVVTSTGHHGLPNDGSQGPSPLLDRWRLGGGCECGGWDMACSLTVLGNSSLQDAGDYCLKRNQQPLELFVQGEKEKSPALTISIVEEGLYAVDFHARLSALQAFSICVAILHVSELSLAIRHENIQLSQSSSLKVLIEKEMKLLIDTIAKEEKKKIVKETPLSFALNPPFSPISRV